MTNQIFITGTIFNKNMKQFNDTFNEGEINYSTQLIVAQRVGQGKGYNGSDYDNKFYNLSYSSKALKKGKYSGLIDDKKRVMVVGRLAQKDFKDKDTGASRQSTVIVADEIIVFETKADTNYNYNIITESDYKMPIQDFGDDDSVL